MGVQIEAIDGRRLQLTGDIKAVLDLPERALAQGFSLAISDGSLVRGMFEAGSIRCRFAVVAEGAAIIRITRHENGDRLDIGWRIDWITLACGGDALCPIDADHADDGRQLTLDIGVREAA